MILTPLLTGKSVTQLFLLMIPTTVRCKPFHNIRKTPYERSYSSGRVPFNMRELGFLLATKNLRPTFLRPGYRKSVFLSEKDEFQSQRPWSSFASNTNPTFYGCWQQKHSKRFFPIRLKQSTVDLTVLIHVEIRWMISLTISHTIPTKLHDSRWYLPRFSKYLKELGTKPLHRNVYPWNHVYLERLSLICQIFPYIISYFMIVGCGLLSHAMINFIDNP